MKSLLSLFFIVSMVLTVSCGDDKKGKSSNYISTDPFNASTFSAYYTPSKQNQIKYGNKWYTIQPFSQTAQQDLMTVNQQTMQAMQSLMQTGSSTVRFVDLREGGTTFIAFPVRVVGSINANNGQVQQTNTMVGVGVAGDVVYVQSIKL